MRTLLLESPKLLLLCAVTACQRVPARSENQPPANVQPALAKVSLEDEGIDANEVRRHEEGEPLLIESAHHVGTGYCRSSFEQACAPGPEFEYSVALVCSGIAEACTAECADSCDDCRQTCIDARKTCERSCSDTGCIDRCRNRAESCHGACKRFSDRCKSAHCNRQVAACARNTERSWEKNACATRCEEFVACRAAPTKSPDAGDAEEAAKLARCSAALNPAYERCVRSCTSRAGSADRTTVPCWSRCLSLRLCNPEVCDLVHDGS